MRCKPSVGRGLRRIGARAAAPFRRSSAISLRRQGGFYCLSFAACPAGCKQPFNGRKRLQRRARAGPKSRKDMHYPRASAPPAKSHPEAGRRNGPTGGRARPMHNASAFFEGCTKMVSRRLHRSHIVAIDLIDLTGAGVEIDEIYVRETVASEQRRTEFIPFLPDWKRNKFRSTDYCGG
jgi:hypothetical protein